MSDLLFEYKVRARHRLGFKEFSFYATTEIEEFLNRNSIEYVRNMTDTVEHRLFKEIERLNNNINEMEKMMKNDLEYACSMNENGLFNGAIDILEDYLYKLQELKGSNNNE